MSIIIPTDSTNTSGKQPSLPLHFFQSIAKDMWEINNTNSSSSSFLHSLQKLVNGASISLKNINKVDIQPLAKLSSIYLPDEDDDYLLLNKEETKIFFEKIYQPNEEREKIRQKTLEEARLFFSKK